MLAGVLVAVPAPAPATVEEQAGVAVAYFLGHKGYLANAELERALARDPANFRANYVAGLIALREKRYADAQPPLERALAARPEDVEAALTYGAVLRKRQQFDRARSVFLGLLAAHPTEPRAVYNMAQLAMTRADLGGGDPSLLEARLYLGRFLAENPQSDDASRVREQLKAVEARIAARAGRRK